MWLKKMERIWVGHVLVGSLTGLLGGTVQIRNERIEYRRHNWSLDEFSYKTPCYLTLGFAAGYFAGAAMVPLWIFAPFVVKETFRSVREKD